jgi:hypothetical protein
LIGRVLLGELNSEESKAGPKPDQRCFRTKHEPEADGCESRQQVLAA